jgi:cytochrome c oxidase subunit 1/cytochrome c oxidase subunit I+III
LTAWWLAALGLVGCGAAIVVWLWPRRELGQRDDTAQPHESGAAS